MTSFFIYSNIIIFNLNDNTDNNIICFNNIAKKSLTLNSEKKLGFLDISNINSLDNIRILNSLTFLHFVQNKRNL